MKRIVSWSALVLSLTVLAFCAWVTFTWLIFLIQRNAILAGEWVMRIAPMFIIACLVLAILPSGILYKQTHERLALLSFRIAGGCALVVVAEVLIMVMALYTVRFYGPGG